MKRSHLSIAAAATICALAVAAVLVTQRKAGDHAGDRWANVKVGDRFRYDLALESSTEATGAAVLSRLVIEGHWTVLVLRLDGGRIELEASLHARKLQMGDGAAAADRGELEASLKRPIFFSFDATGAIADIRPDRQVSALAETVLRSLVSYSQVVLAATDRKAGQWTSDERDHTGHYQARYTRLDAHNLDKQKLRYTSVSQPGSPQLAVQNSHQQIALSPGGWLQRLVLEESIGAALGHELKLVNRTRLRLDLTDRANDVQAAVAALAQAARRPAIAVDAPPVSRDVYRQWDRARAEGHSVQDLLPQLLTARAAGQTSDSNDLFGRLASVLRVDETAVTDVVTRLSQPDRDWKLLVDALAAAGTPPAQAALVDLIHQPPSATVARGAVLAALSMVRSPTAESVSALTALADDAELGGQAKLGLGSYAGFLNEDEPERAREVLALVTEGLERSTGSARLDYLDALGNAGMREAVPTVEKHLQSTDAEVREHAVRALRRAPGAEVDRHLVQRLRDDQAAIVRTSAALAIRDRAPSADLAAALDRAARVEPDLVTRFTALKTIVTHLDTVPQLRSALQWAAMNDPNPELRRTLEGYRR